MTEPTPPPQDAPLPPAPPPTAAAPPVPTPPQYISPLPPVARSYCDIAEDPEEMQRMMRDHPVELAAIRARHYKSLNQQYRALSSIGLALAFLAPLYLTGCNNWFKASCMSKEGMINFEAHHIHPSPHEPQPKDADKSPTSTSPNAAPLSHP